MAISQVFVDSVLDKFGASVLLVKVPMLLSCTKGYMVAHEKLRNRHQLHRNMSRNLTTKTIQIKLEILRFPEIFNLQPTWPTIKRPSRDHPLPPGCPGCKAVARPASINYCGHLICELLTDLPTKTQLLSMLRIHFCSGTIVHTPSKALSIS